MVKEAEMQVQHYWCGSATGGCTGGAVCNLSLCVLNIPLPFRCWYSYVRSKGMESTPLDY